MNKIMKHVPNFLSALRIFLVPVFVYLYFRDIPNAHWWAMGVYLFAMATDVVDGYIARKYDAVSDMGRILDPVGDKLMNTAAIACLAIEDKLPSWLLVFFMVKELTMVTGGLIINRSLKAEMPSSNFFGKAATALIFITVVLVMLVDVPKSTVNILLFAVVVMSLTAFASYAYKFLRLLKEDGEKNEK